MSNGSHNGRQDDNEEKDGGIPTPSTVLAVLRAASSSDDLRQQMIIEAEALPLDNVAEAQELMAVLANYIEQRRFTGDPHEMVAVGSAIRKYVAMMPRRELGSLVPWLKVTPTKPVSVEVELELTKMIVRKLTADPPVDPDPYAELGEQLLDLAEAYLHPRLLARPCYAAVALYCVEALIMLGSPRVANLLERLSQLSSSWMPRLIARRVRTLMGEVLGAPSAGHAAVLERLNTFAANQAVAVAG